MPRYLNLARAARLAGVSRQELQSRIRAGDISTFEGRIDVDILTRLYPAAQPEDEAVLERVQRLREKPPGGYDINHVPSAARLAEEVNRLRLALDDAEVEIAAYRQFCEELRRRISALQVSVAYDERQVLQALANWMYSQLERRA